MHGARRLSGLGRSIGAPSVRRRCSTPHANIAPGQTGVKMVPISRMVPRSFFTNITDGASPPTNAATTIRGITFGGDAGVAKVELSMNDRQTWQPATLGDAFGKYSFRRWQAAVPRLTPGAVMHLRFAVRN